MICPRCGHDNIPGDDQCARCTLDLAPLDQPAPRDRVQSDLVKRRVRDLQPGPPITVPDTTALGQAVAILIEESVGSVLVVDGDGRLVGIFSERDLLQRVPDAEARTGDRPLSAFMSKNPVTVQYDDSLAVALHRMDVGGYRHLPVVVDGKPVGIISARDLVLHLANLCRD